MSCEHCARKHGNKPILDIGAAKAAVEFDGFDWILEVTARQEDRWYGDITEYCEINFCPMCGEKLGGAR